MCEFARSQERFLRLRSAAQLAELIKREFPVVQATGGGKKQVAGFVFALAVVTAVTIGGLIVWRGNSRSFDQPLPAPVGEDADGTVKTEALSSKLRQSSCVKVTVRGVETDSKKVSKIEGFQQKVISLYVSKDEDSEVVIEIPKGQRLTFSEAIEFVAYDDAIVNAAMNQDWAKVRALQKSFKLKKITLKVVGGGELDVPKLKFSLAGVEDDLVIVNPEMKIAKLPN